MQDELRARRVALGLSQADVARAVGISPPMVGHIERGEIRGPSLEDLWAIGAVLGLDLRLGAYPAGEPVHDRVQLPMLETVHAMLPATSAWRTELGLPNDGDLRAWDAVVIAPDGWTAIEAISTLGAVDATVRSVNLKQRDDPRIARVVLLINDTERNRGALRLAGTVIRGDFPLTTHEVLAHLRAGRTPPLNGIATVRPRRRP